MINIMIYIENTIICDYITYNLCYKINNIINYTY